MIIFEENLIMFILFILEETNKRDLEKHHNLYGAVGFSYNDEKTKEDIVKGIVLFQVNVF